MFQSSVSTSISSLNCIKIIVTQKLFQYNCRLHPFERNLCQYVYLGLTITAFCFRISECLFVVIWSIALAIWRVTDFAVCKLFAFSTNIVPLELEQSMFFLKFDSVKSFESSKTAICLWWILETIIFIADSTVLLAWMFCFLLARYDWVIL